MPSNLNLDYYYGTEADQYSFYRIPKTLLTDPRYKSVSIEAKVLYGLLLDRMGLSIKNGWMDSDGRVYIYFTQEDAMNLMIADTKQNIEKVESIGHELRSVGGHLKNAGRTLTGKETQTVDGGQEGRFQSVVLAPMRTTQKLLSGMNNATLAAIGGMESLELSAEAAREARTERQAEKKPSIRQALAEKRAEAAAQPAPAQDKEHKAPEAAL